MDAIDIENTLVDKLGKNDIKWEKDGFSDHRKLWITYEEVIDATTSHKVIQTEEGSRDRNGQCISVTIRDTLLIWSRLTTK